MTILNFEAFMEFSAEDVNAFLKANQNESTLTDAELQTFLEMKIDGFSFLNLTDDELEMRLHVREWAARKRTRMLINEIRASAATTAPVAAAETSTQTPSSLTADEKTTIRGKKLGLYRWPAIIREWNFKEDLLLWKEKYQEFLAETVPSYDFPSDRMRPCTQESDVHHWWYVMVAAPLNIVLRNGIKAVMFPVEADLTPDFGFVGDGKVKLAGNIKCPWHMLAKGPATAPDFMIRKSSIHQALAQLYGFMDNNECRYGVLTTYTFTWFVKQSGVKGELLISPPISYNNSSPTLFESYFYLVCELEETGFRYDKSVENLA